jgi:hypothetical protein
MDTNKIKNMTNIGFFHPSVPMDEILDNLSFLVATKEFYARNIIEAYPNWDKPIRTYVQNGKDSFNPVFFKEKIDSMTLLRGYAESHEVQIVFNELFYADGNLRSFVKKHQLIDCISYVIQSFKNVEIIINEMNPYHLIKYTGNGFQNNGVIPFINELKGFFPNTNFSLGIQTIGNYLCKDVLLLALDAVLNHVIPHPALVSRQLTIHFTEIGYFYEPPHQQEQKEFLDKVIAVAKDRNIASMTFMYPWDGDKIALHGQPKRSICGIYDQDWGVKYDVFG